MITSCLSLVLLAGIPRSVLGISATQESLMEDIVGVWSQFRDPDTGLWCDTLRFTSGTGLHTYILYLNSAVNVKTRRKTKNDRIY